MLSSICNTGSTITSNTQKLAKEIDIDTLDDISCYATSGLQIPKNGDIAVTKIEKIIDVKSGSKGSWDKNINGGLEPNTMYKLETGASYTTDASGRVARVDAELSLTKMDRNTYQQCIVGHCGNVGDEGGHLIASSLGGAGDRINLVPQAEILNKGDWKKMENLFRDELAAGKQVNMKIEVGYPADGGARPNEFIVTSNIDGVYKEFIFKQ